MPDSNFPPSTSPATTAPAVAPPTTALAVVQPDRYAVARADQRGLLAIKEACDLGAGAFDLTQVRVPSGGGSFFQLPDARGEIQPVKEIEGVLVAVRTNLKAWFEKSFADTGGGSQPDCSSGDAMFGFGVRDLPKVEGKAPSKLKCAECKHNQFGSARKGTGFGKGKDCQDYALLFFYREGDFLPSVLKASATSLSALKSYGIFLAGRGRDRTSVTTLIGLQQDQSDGGIPYSKLTFKIGALLDDAATARFVALQQAVSERLLTKFDPSTFAEPAAT
jgi:hypothetical protein